MHLDSVTLALENFVQESVNKYKIDTIPVCSCKRSCCIKGWTSFPQYLVDVFRWYTGLINARLEKDTLLADMSRTVILVEACREKDKRKQLTFKV